MSLSVLVVDDDPTIRRLAEVALTRAGYVVHQAGDGREALDLLTATGATILVTDWLMPRLDGIELCRTLRAKEDLYGRVYVLVLTSLDEPERIVEAFDAGADDYLPKPFHRSELVARVGAAARMVRLQAALSRKEIELHRQNAELEIAAHELERANARLDRMATTDELTDLPNRRAATKALSRMWNDEPDEAGPGACVVLDIDHFKSFNDTYGHDLGDRVLAEVADVLRQNTRRAEQVFRYGGEEFLLICPMSNGAAAARAAERMRAAVDEHALELDDGREISLTVSLGVAERRWDMEQWDDLVKAADTALYAAKDAGRNRVAVAEGIDLERPKSAGGRYDTAITTPEAPEEESADPLAGGRFVPPELLRPFEDLDDEVARRSA